MAEIIPIQHSEVDLSVMERVARTCAICRPSNKATLYELNQIDYEYTMATHLYQAHGLKNGTYLEKEYYNLLLPLITDQALTILGQENRYICPEADCGYLFDVPLTPSAFTGKKSRENDEKKDENSAPTRSCNIQTY